MGVFKGILLLGMRSTSYLVHHKSGRVKDTLDSFFHDIFVFMEGQG